MRDLPARKASLSPAKRELLARRMRHALQTSGQVIPTRDRNMTVPLSPIQERLWFLDQFRGGGVAYNLSQAYRLRGDLNVGVLAKAFEAVLARHESLRTTFDNRDGHGVQIVGGPKPFEMPVDPAESIDHARQLADKEARRPFDLLTGPLLRARLIRLAPRDHLLVVTMHHIISDGWSVAVLWMDLSSFYRAFVTGESPPLRELPVQYADFALWQRGRLAGVVQNRQLAYWREQLRGAPAAIELPYDRRPSTSHAFAGSSWYSLWPESLLSATTALGGRAGATSFMTLMAAFAVLLHRYSGHDDLVIGTPIAARTTVETEPMIGLFVNTLPLRIRLGGSPTFLELLGRVRQATLDAGENQDVPFDVLVADLRPARPRADMPLVQVMFGFQNARRTYLDLPGVTASLVPVETGTSKFDLTVELLNTPKGLSGRFEYNSDIFDPETVAQMGEHYRRLLEAAAADPLCPIGRLPMLSEQERQRIVSECSGPTSDYLAAGSVSELVESWSARTGDAVAAVDGKDALTYSQLNSRANRLAHRLRSMGIGPECLVGICLERSLDMVVAMLAVLKAGGAYVPLDVDSPPMRLMAMLADTRARVVLTHSQWRRVLPPGPAAVLCLDTDWDGLPADDSNPPPTVTSDNLAYVIYTSGSTGTPKGVAVTHRAILRLVINADYAPLGPGEVVAQASNACFDAATFEVWGPLANGATLAIVPTEILLDPSALAAEILRQGITTLFVTTALFNRIAEECPQAFRPLRRLLFGGEACDPAAVAKVLRDGRPEHLLHMYGPTETTTFATWYAVENIPEGAATVSVGRPIANTTALVLDDGLALVPPGVRGQLYIGGPGLARSYLNDTDLTARRFIPHPWDPQCGRLYRTGDLARHRRDGNLELLGRLDEQVKIRGFRVELSEVESALRTVAGVREAVVVARPDVAGSQVLKAYVTGAEGLGSEQLRSALVQRLPAYMVPAAFVVLNQLPMTPSGKVDRRALPVVEGGASDKRYRAPRNSLEQALAAIWQDVLGVSRVGIDDNFFDDLGGHSLLAVRLFARIERQMGRRLPIATLFDAPTVEALAGVLIREGWSTQGLRPVTLCCEGAGRPFFLVTPMDAFEFLDLARAMGKQRPLHVLHPLTTVDSHRPTIDMGDLAAHYAEQMQAIQPAGPYLLGGYSVGGVLAFEAARLLQAKGCRVGILVLLDSWCPQHGWARRINRLVRWHVIRYGRTLLRLRGRDRLTYLMDVCRPWQRRRLKRSSARQIGEPGNAPASPYWRQFQEAYEAACARYIPGTFDGRPVQILSSKEPMELLDPRLLWDRFATGGLAIHRFPGNHREILMAPRVSQLAAALNRILTDAESASSG